ncbi:MAG: hypothetical protein ABIH46_06870, partial [Chloroflexota bacterium]
MGTEAARLYATVGADIAEYERNMARVETLWRNTVQGVVGERWGSIRPAITDATGLGRTAAATQLSAKGGYLSGIGMEAYYREIDRAAKRQGAILGRQPGVEVLTEQYATLQAESTPERLATQIAKATGATAGWSQETIALTEHLAQVKAENAPRLMETQIAKATGAMAGWSQETVALRERTAELQAQLEVPRLTAGIKRMEAELAGTDKTAKTLTQTVRGIRQAMTLAFGAYATAKFIVKPIYELAKFGGQIERIEAGMDVLAGSSGKASEMVERLRDVSQGTISDYQLMLNANQAMILEVTQDTEVMARLLEVAMVRGRMMGIGTAEAFDRITRGIGRLSPKILDDIGIVTGGIDTYQDYADSIGKTVSEMTAAEKRVALLNKVLEESDQLVKDAGGVARDTASSFERWEAATENLKNELAKFLAKGMAPTVSTMADATSETAKFITELGRAKAAFIDLQEVAGKRAAALPTVMTPFGPAGGRQAAAVVDVSQGIAGYLAELAFPIIGVIQGFERLSSILPIVTAGLSKLAGLGEESVAAATGVGDMKDELDAEMKSMKKFLRNIGRISYFGETETEAQRLLRNLEQAFTEQFLWPESIIGQLQGFVARSLGQIAQWQGMMPWRSAEDIEERIARNARVNGILNAFYDAQEDIVKSGLEEQLRLQKSYYEDVKNVA